VFAQPTRADQAAPRPLHPTVRALDAQLHGDDAGAKQQALSELGKSRYHDDAAAALAAYLSEGLPDALADATVEALGQTGSPRALQTLSRFRRHRRAGLRRLVYRAIADVQDASAVPLLVGGLRDSDAGVRGVAATMLGDRKAVSELDVLFHALARGVPEAADSIGRIAGADALPRYDAYLETLPLGVMLDGYRRFLERRDLSEQAQLDIVGRLGEVASRTVKTFLLSLLDRGDFRKRERLRFAIEQTAKRIADKPAPPGAR